MVLRDERCSFFLNGCRDFTTEELVQILKDERNLRLVELHSALNNLGCGDIGEDSDFYIDEYDDEYYGGYPCRYAEERAAQSRFKFVEANNGSYTAADVAQLIAKYLRGQTLIEVLKTRDIFAWARSETGKDSLYTWTSSVAQRAKDKKLLVFGNCI